MNIDDVHSGIKKNRRRRRVGRGPGSGHGKTSGRGHKGAGSRAGYSVHSSFEGGRMPMVRRVPKRGFNNRWARTIFTLNVSDLDKLFEDGAEVSFEVLRERQLMPSRFELFKVLGDGVLSKKLTVSAHRFSKSAAEKIKQAGGEVVEVPEPAPVVKPPKSEFKSNRPHAKSS